MRSWNNDLGKTVAEPEGKKRLGATIAIGPGLEVAHLHAAGIAAGSNSSSGDVWLAQNRMKLGVAASLDGITSFRFSCVIPGGFMGKHSI
jgi:hypothetical protein